MAWIQLKFDISPEESEAYEDALLETGALAVTFTDLHDNPVYEPDLGTTPLWADTVLAALFEADVAPEAVIAMLSAITGKSLAQLPKWQAEIVEDKDWEREWMDRFEPINFNDRLWVVPSWKEPPNPKAANLRLDPGLAFGTGTHPTTYMCMQWLSENDVNNKTVTDYGCGSGILGIAALLLGAKSMTGIDIDPQAIIATKNNAIANGVSENLLKLWLPNEVQSELCDVMLANILAGPLVELASDICGLLRSGGDIVLSGILKDQAEDVLSAYSTWIDFDPVCEHDGWVRLSGTKR